MRPAWSVVFLTTLIGAGQGLVLALFAAEFVLIDTERGFYVAGSIAALALTAGGLFASFFHLGRPERAWRSAAMWRTSWLSREVIALPAFMAATAAYGYAHYVGSSTATIGTLAALASLALFVCTSQIYACVKFLQEWASPFTLPNFLLMGCASGATLAAALAAAYAPEIAGAYAIIALVLTAAALAVRLASLARNARVVPRSTLQSAIGVNAPKVRQVSQGFTAGAFNTHEFFHGRSPEAMRRMKLTFLIGAFALPLLLLGAALATATAALVPAAFAVQYCGLLVERWYFLADARHPQNLYYQSVA